MKKLSTMSIEEFRGKHSGERIFLVGNGPSLQETPLELLKGEYSMAMNQIYDIFSGTEWRPTYYLQVNPPPYETEKMYTGIFNMIERGITSFVAQGAKPGLKEFEQFERLDTEHHINYLELLRPKSGPSGYFIKKAKEGNYHSFWSKDLTKGVYFKATSMYVAGQIASYMGFDELYFIGCDLYPEFNPVPYAPLKSGSDPSEFNPVHGTWRDYWEFVINSSNSVTTLFNAIWFKLVYRTSILDLIYQIQTRLGDTKQTHFSTGQTDKNYYTPGKNNDLINTHKIISAVALQNDIDCYNATVGGNLEVYPRVDVKDKITN